MANENWSPASTQLVATRIQSLSLPSSLARIALTICRRSLGASAVAIGRPYIWGLAAAGQAGVEQVLDILDGELAHIMRLAGVTSIDRITREHVTRRG